MFNFYGKEKNQRILSTLIFLRLQILFQKKMKFTELFHSIVLKGSKMMVS